MKGRKGSVIAFEGLDGTGKTTQGRLLQDYLKRAGIDASIHLLYKNDLVERMLTRHDEKGCTSEVGARYAVVSKILSQYEWLIQPMINQGKYFILDKYIYTFMTTEIVRGCKLDELQQMFLDLPRPDIAFVFLLDPQELLARKIKSGHIGYRESGMDLQLYQGKPVDFNEFQKGKYPKEWIQEQFLLFQYRLVKSFKTVIESEKECAVNIPNLRNPIIHYVDAKRSIKEIHEEIKLTATQRGII